METLKKESLNGQPTEKVTITGAEAVVRCLLEEGSTLGYGYPGGAIMPVYDELFKYKRNFTMSLLVTNKEQYTLLRDLHE